MDMKEVVEGNKLICEFLGNKIEGAWVMLGDDYNGRYNVSILKYHSSWSELMPVVEKIEEIGSNDSTRYNVSIEINSCFIQQWVDGEKGELIAEWPDSPDKIDAVWNAIIQFIQWHNNSKTQ